MRNQEQSVERDGRSLRASRPRDLPFEEVKSAVEGIRYGEVRVIIQDGVIIQIERVEKRRLK